MPKKEKLSGKTSHRQWSQRIRLLSTSPGCDQALEVVLQTGQVAAVQEVLLGKGNVPCKVLEDRFPLVDRLRVASVVVNVRLVGIRWGSKHNEEKCKS